MTYSVNPDTIGPSAQAGQPNATTAAASSIRASTWPYKRFASQSDDPKILLRPPAEPDAPTDPVLLALSALQGQMEAVSRNTRLIAAPWLIEPPDSESFHIAAGIVIPLIAVGVYSTVVSVLCPAGRNGVVNRIANEFVGGGFTDFSGALIRRNQPSSGGTTAAERNYQNITASLGSVVNPTRISGIRIFENDVLSLVVSNTSIIPAGEAIGGLFGGYFYPRTWDDQYEAQERDRSNSW